MNPYILNNLSVIVLLLPLIGFLGYLLYGRLLSEKQAGMLAFLDFIVICTFRGFILTNFVIRVTYKYSSLRLGQYGKF
ncbi:MAG: hypothetical protein IPJ13_24390 [Saprospiraceae bacterium]|nr:hypothetical protein [Saprospiraceae bacterium]